MISRHSAANRCSLSSYSCAHQAHRAAGLPNIIRRCATLHLRNVVVVNPGHEPWGGSFYYCDACLQCAFGISNGFYVISCQPAQVLIFGYVTQPAKGHRPTVAPGVCMVENGSLYLLRNRHHWERVPDRKTIHPWTTRTFPCPVPT